MVDSFRRKSQRSPDAVDALGVDGRADERSGIPHVSDLHPAAGEAVDLADHGSSSHVLPAIRPVLLVYIANSRSPTTWILTASAATEGDAIARWNYCSNTAAQAGLKLDRCRRRQAVMARALGISPGQRR
jgi:hypothetical protein